MKFRWERLTDVTKTNVVHVWYKHTQERLVSFGIPLMPFRGISLQHEEYGIYMPDMCCKLYEVSNRLLLKVLWKCVPDDASKEADNIREMMAIHTNGWETM